MGDIDFVLPWRNQYFQFVEETLEFTKNHVLFVPRKILQTALKHPAITLVLSVASLIGFFPFILFASFAVGTSGLVLLHLLVVQGIAGFMMIMGLSGVLFLVITLTGVVLASLYGVYRFWMTVYNVCSYVANLVALFRMYIQHVQFFFNALKNR